MKHKYSIQIVWSPEDNAYLASPAELAGCLGCLADGATQEDALKNLDVVIDEWIEVAKDEGRSIPNPMTLEDFQQARKEFEESLQQHIRKRG